MGEVILHGLWLLLQFLFEFLLQAIGETAIEWSWRRGVQVSRWWIYPAFLVGGILLGIASAFLFPVGINQTTAMRLIALFGMPVVLALTLNTLREMLGWSLDISARSYMARVALFGFGFGLARFLMVY